MSDTDVWDAIVVGGGIAGLSAAIYLGRAQRGTLVIDSGKSMAQWEPKVENYLGFPRGISGEELLIRGQQQAKQYGVHFAADEISKAERQNEKFKIRGRKKSYQTKFLLLRHRHFSHSARYQWRKRLPWTQHVFLQGLRWRSREGQTDRHLWSQR